MDEWGIPQSSILVGFSLVNHPCWECCHAAFQTKGLRLLPILHEGLRMGDLALGGAPPRDPWGNFAAGFEDPNGWNKKKEGLSRRD